jgi:hypothetical protein
MIKISAISIKGLYIKVIFMGYKSHRYVFRLKFVTPIFAKNLKNSSSFYFLFYAQTIYFCNEHFKFNLSILRYSGLVK